MEHELSTLTATRPLLFSVSPSMADNKEDFPLPTCPTTATREPRGTCTLILSAKTEIVQSPFVFIQGLVIFFIIFFFYNSYLLRHGGPSADQLKVPFSIATSSPSEQNRKIE